MVTVRNMQMAEGGERAWLTCVRQNATLRH